MFDDHGQLFNNLNQAFCIIEVVFDDSGKGIDLVFLDVNECFTPLTGIMNPVGKRAKDIIPGLEESWAEIYGKVVTTKKPILFENRAEGLDKWFNLFAYPFGLPDKNQVAVVFTDITKNKKAEQELKKSQQRFTDTLDSIKEGCAIIGYDWTYLYVNDTNAKQAFMKKEDMLGRRLQDVFPGMEQHPYFEYFSRAMYEREYQHYEGPFTFAGGTEVWFELLVNPCEDGILVIVIDITSRKKAELGLENALHEKEIIIKELYHRTKNNLQVVSGLLSLKASKFKDKDYREALFEMQNRIQSMSLVHERLYKTQNLNSLNLGSYIKDLVDLLIEGNIDTSKINFEHELNDCEVNIETAIPCGLIITELVLNVFKYAFPDERSGTLFISLTEGPDKIIKLIVSDNGVGIPADQLDNQDKLGMQLVQGLVEQLNGTITLAPQTPGTRWMIKFEKK